MLQQPAPLIKGQIAQKACMPRRVIGVRLHMFPAVTLIVECFVTPIATKRFFTCVGSDVNIEHASVLEPSFAEGADVRPPCGVYAQHVPAQVDRLCECLVAFNAFATTRTVDALAMRVQVVDGTESASALFARVKMLCSRFSFLEPASSYRQSFQRNANLLQNHLFIIESWYNLNSFVGVSILWYRSCDINLGYI